MKFLVLILLCAVLIVSCSTREKADLIIRNATIYTMNEHFDKASVMVVSKGKVMAIGGDSLLNLFTSDNIMDAKDKFVYPGFIDAHCHFTGYAMDAYKLKLFGTSSFDEVIQKVVAFAKTNKRIWIEGTGWDQNDWTEKKFPTKDTLDRLFPDKPVFLLRVDGHAALVNQKALDICKISNTTKVNGGEIDIKTGILIDNAIELVRKYLPELTKEEAIHDIIAAQQEFFKVGLTSVVECGVKKNVVEWLTETYEANKLQLRSTVMLINDKENFDSFLNKEPYRNDYFHVAGYKVFTDGSLGSRGAFMLKEYSDRHGHSGALLLSADSLARIAQQVGNSSYQLCAHAIGDAANRTVLQIYGDVLKTKNDRRWRIEHAQVVDTNDIHYFGDFSIVPSVQPTHATSDMYWVKDRIGNERTKEAYAYHDLLQQNGWLPLGTDFPVENLNPIYTFYAAVFRKDQKDFPEGGFQTENSLSREEALRGMTIWAARSVFEEKEKGSLEAGKLADFVLLDIDLMKAEAKQVYHAKVLATYIGGKKVYDCFTKPRTD